ncbi:hypothetical protein [Azospirillum argentinense]|uniref:Uncharacterized protein n=1 Tax=Azospirillum argentinense TaxID=2970906 RepID=A0A5B0KND1_9PROT|nr:hypothetical protein [Azospirillum argentinense]KAA1053779.1 hypothetical protein FH063_002361 [Azospirillum argentinense]
MTGSRFCRHQPVEAVEYCFDGRCKGGNCLGYCTKDRKAQREEAANWLRQGASVVCTYDSRIMGDHMTGRVGTIRRLCGPPFDDHCYVVFLPVGRERKPRERMMQLSRLEPFDPEAPWRPVLDGEQLRTLAAIQENPSAPLVWVQERNSRWRLAQTLAALGLVRRPPGKKAWEEPWTLTERGQGALALLAQPPSA